MLISFPVRLAKMGRNEDARQILSVLRCKKDDSPEELAGRVELELQGIIETVQEERKQEEKGMEPQECLCISADPADSF